MADTSVSVIIPAYKAGAYLERAVLSALGQTHAPLEVLVVDDGSPDNTFEVASSFQKPVRALRKPNGGPASARNLGASEAIGEWIAFLDADDIWLPAKLERQIALASPDTDVVHCLYSPRLHPKDVVTFEDLWERNCIGTSTVLLRRAAFLRLGGFDEDRSIIGVEDYNLWLRLAAAKSRIITAQETLISYTPAAGSLTKQVERFAGAELAHLEKIARLLNLDSNVVAKKRARLLEDYGRELLYWRHLDRARDYLRESLRIELSRSRLAWWAASWVPKAVWLGWDRMRGHSHV
jgi:glycosyltransferase involved in cell wall biosynthesis